MLLSPKRGLSAIIVAPKKRLNSLSHSNSDYNQIIILFWGLWFTDPLCPTLCITSRDLHLSPGAPSFCETISFLFLLWCLFSSRQYKKLSVRYLFFEVLKNGFDSPTEFLFEKKIIDGWIGSSSLPSSSLSSSTSTAITTIVIIVILNLNHHHHHCHHCHHQPQPPSSTPSPTDNNKNKIFAWTIFIVQF